MKMNKLTSISLISAFVLSASAASAETGTIVFGNSNSWSSFGFSDNFDTGTGGHDAVITQDGITFTLNVISTADSGGETQISGNGGLIPATSGNVWENDDGTLILSLSFSESSSTLDTLKVGNLDIEAWNASNEDMNFAAFDNPTGVTIDSQTSGIVTSGRVSYDDLGITQLIKGNIASWTLEIDMVDTGSVQGLDYIEFDYTYTVPEPGTYALLAGCAALGFVMLRRRR
jgi:hypothetical protein